MGASACGAGSQPSSTTNNVGGEGACVFVVHWHGVTYTGVSVRFKAEGLTPADIRRPHNHGDPVGTAQVPVCADGGEGGSVQIYAVPGIDTATAVMTADKQIGVAEGVDIPEVLISRTQ